MARLNVPDNKETAQTIVKAAMTHPAVIGYSVRDEPPASMFARLAEVKRWGSKLDPKGLYFVNLFPNYANTGQLGTDTYEQYVEQYIQVFHPQVICFDHYPLAGKTGYRPG